MKRRKSYIFSFSLIVVAAIGLLIGVSVLFVRFIGHLGTKDDKTALAPPQFSVLYICSYDPNYEVSNSQFEGISKVFNSNNIHFDSLYMDMKNFDTAENYELFYNTVKYKSSITKKYDAILVSDDPALTFIKFHANEFFSDTPIVFFGINNIEFAEEMAANPLITGFTEELFFEDTLKLAVLQNPRYSTIVTLFDNSLTSAGDKKQYAQFIKKYPNLSFVSLNISDWSFDSLMNIVDEISKDSIVICVPSMQDYTSTGKFSSFDFLSFLDRYAEKVPIYRTHPSGIGAGFVGGKVFDDEKASAHAAQTVVDILNGKPVSEIPMEKEKIGQFLFDWAALKKFNLDSSILPFDTIYINRPNEFLRSYGKIMFPVTLIIISLICLFVAAMISYKRAMKANGIMMLMNQKMRQTNKELNDSKCRLTYVANNDSLTALPNRSHGEDEILHIMESGIPFSLFLMDIDDFKNYNDTYTHACGDFILREYGRRLAAISQTNDYFAARYGGDEFLLVHKNGHIEKNGREIEELRAILNEPIIYNNMKLDIVATLGFVDSSPGLTFDELISNADIAMYEAKKIGRGSILCFSPEMKETIVRKNRIIEILKEECIKGGFEIRYQPQVNAQTGEIYGFEALVRLQDYSLGPGDFIPVAEDGGFIAQIGRIVTEKVISQMAQWRSEGMNLKKIAINYSNGQLVDDEYVPFLKELLEKYQIEPKLVEIEITESLFMGNSERAKQLFEELAKIGVGLALDDFGTGYSSLSYLTFVPAQKVKIDKSLVDNYLVDGKESFIQNIVHLVHDLGMKLTVEGVEKKWQYDKLREMNCDFIQGYFFSKPIHANDVPQFSVEV